ncbi:hypothetical protein Plhal304r1_c041g0120161 [Plasmopara halstedii]
MNLVVRLNLDGWQCFQNTVARSSISLCYHRSTKVRDFMKSAATIAQVTRFTLRRMPNIALWSNQRSNQRESGSDHDHDNSDRGFVRSYFL